MSQAEEESSRPPSGGEEEEEEQSSRSTSAGEEEEEEEDTPLSALAPDASLPEERPSTSAHISTSPAFHSLEELLSLGRISETQAARLKASYKLLKDTLKSTQESEIELLGEAKRLRAELDGLRGALERAEEQATAEGSDSEVTQLRQQLLKHYNTRFERQQTQEELDHQMDCLQEQKQCLEREYEAQHKPVEVDIEMNVLKDSCEELRRDVTERRLEVRGRMEELEVRQKQTEREQKELDDKQDTVQFKQMELACLLPVPTQLLKEIERMERKKTEAEKKVDALDEEISDLGRRREEEEERKRELEKERKSVSERRRALREVAERENLKLQREQENFKENEALIMQERIMLDVKLRNIMMDSKNLWDKKSRLLKEKDKQERGRERMQLSLKLAKESLQHTLVIYNNTKAQRDALPKGEAGLQRRLTLLKEVDALKLHLQQQERSVGEEEVQREHQEALEELLKEVGRCREELHHLLVLTHIKTEERDQKARELLRAQQKYQRIKDEVAEKALVIKERKQLSADLQRRLLECVQMNEEKKVERNGFVALSCVAMKTMEGLKEDFNRLDTAIELQRQIAIDKDRLLAKERLKTHYSSVAKENLRKDISKMSWVVQELQVQREDQKFEVIKLTHVINSREQDLLHLRKKYEAAVRSHQERSVELLERHGEICVLWEKVNAQEAELRKRREGMKAREEELRTLPPSIREESRQIDLRRKLLPSKTHLERERTVLKIQLSESNDRLLELEKALQDPTRQNRARELEGADPSPEELIQKIEQLEVGLAQQEEQLLDKELLQEQVDRLSQRIRSQAEKGQLDTLQYAQKMNELQCRDKQMTRRMMAVVAELSMKQAELMSLQKELKEKELQVDGCQRRLEQGLAPCPEMEQDWMKTLREDRRRLRDRLERERLLESEEWRQLPNGVLTTAEARPESYIPRDASLPLPRPYGALAPFKPSEPGSNFRHIRKPQPKPIQI